ncbi:MAG: hypothetical protein ACTHM6_11425 [Tepidisphaeraceae bacterium]
MTRDELIDLLNRRFALVGHGIQFDIVNDGVRQDGAWWYVPVLATRNGQAVAREFAVNVFAQIEDEIEQQYAQSVLFVPVVNEPAVG